MLSQKSISEQGTLLQRLEIRFQGGVETRPAVMFISTATTVVGLPMLVSVDLLGTTSSLNIRMLFRPCGSYLIASWICILDKTLAVAVTAMLGLLNMWVMNGMTSSKVFTVLASLSMLLPI